MERAVADVLVAGLGSPLLGDDGVGAHVVRRLMELRSGRFADVEFADLGASMMRVVHAMAGRRRAVFIDCAFMGEEPGVLRRFTPDEARSLKSLPRLSLHEGDLLQAIELSRSLGECPNAVVIFGVQPESVEPREELSPILRERLDDYAAAVLAEVS